MHVIQSGRNCTMHNGNIVIQRVVRLVTPLHVVMILRQVFLLAKLRGASGGRGTRLQADGNRRAAARRGGRQARSGRRRWGVRRSLHCAAYGMHVGWWRRCRTKNWDGRKIEFRKYNRGGTGRNEHTSANRRKESKNRVGVEKGKERRWKGYKTQKVVTVGKQGRRSYRQYGCHR